MWTPTSQLPAKAVLILLLGMGNIHCATSPDILEKNIDRSVKPGDDFYHFANGKWIKNNPIPSTHAQWGIGNLVQEEIWQKLKDINEKALRKIGESKTASETTLKIGNFYSAALNETQIEKHKLEPLQYEIQLIEAIHDQNTLFKAISHLQSLWLSPAFEMSISPDLKNSQLNVLYLGQGGLGLPNRDYYLEQNQRTQEIRIDYQTQYIPRMLSLYRKGFERGSKAVYDLEKSIAEHSRKLEDLRDPYRNYHFRTITQLIRDTPNIPWKSIFSQLGIQTNYVVVGQPEFFKHLNHLFKTTPLSTWKDYLRLQMVSKFAPYLHAEADQENFRFYSGVLQGRQEQLPRWKRALIWEEDALGESLGQLYVEENFSKDQKKRYSDLCIAVLAAFSERIKNLEWMSKSTQQKALRKLRAVRQKVGYPDQWRDTSALKITDSSLMENVKSSNQFWFDYYLKKINKPVDQTEWNMTPQTYNAYYSPSRNEIVLPAAIFELPGVQDKQMDDAIIYGYAGASTIGHEITHGFDDQGRQFDEKGNLMNWWSRQDAEKFNQKVEDYIQQFNEYVVLGNVRINGKASIGENIADLGGLVIALDAFKKTEQFKEEKRIAGFTPIQRFFLGYAYGWLKHQRDEDLRHTVMTDQHAPSFLRVNGPFSNIDDFYEAFSVQAGEKMYRPKDKRIKIW